MSGELAGALSTTDFAVLVRDVQVNLVNLSSSGCLVESSFPFDVGTIASLALTLDGVRLRDDVQVVRCHRIEGAGSAYHVGMRFLWTTLPDALSLRGALRNRGGGHASGEAVV